MVLFADLYDTKARKLSWLSPAIKLDYFDFTFLRVEENAEPQPQIHFKGESKKKRLPTFLDKISPPYFLSSTFLEVHTLTRKNLTWKQYVSANTICFSLVPTRTWQLVLIVFSLHSYSLTHIYIWNSSDMPGGMFLNVGWYLVYRN